MRRFACALLLVACHASLAVTLTIVSPVDKAVVSLLSVDQKAYLDMGRAERRAQYADYAARKRIAKFGDRPQQVPLDWRLSGTNGTERVRYVVRVTSEPGGAPFWKGETEHSHVRLDNFEAGRTATRSSSTASRAWTGRGRWRSSWRRCSAWTRTSCTRIGKCRVFRRASSTSVTRRALTSW